MKKVKAFLNYIWHYQLRADSMDWIVVKDCYGYRSAYVGEEVNIYAFSSEEKMNYWLENSVPKDEIDQCRIYRSVKK